MRCVWNLTFNKFTGKTKVLVEMVLQVLETDPTTRLLVCAPSHSACDTIAMRLADHLQPDRLLRLNRSTRTFAEVPDRLMPYCYAQSGYFQLPPFEQFLRRRVIICTCADAEILVLAALTNHQQSQLHADFLKSRYAEHQLDIRSPLFWTDLLVDECGQASEPETLIPLQVVFPGVENLKRPRVVLLGDQHQLGPRVRSATSRSCNLHVSLMERLMQRPLYNDHPLARNQLRRMGEAKVANAGDSLSADILAVAFSKSSDSTSAMTSLHNCLWNIRPPFANLFRNYRSHPSILMIPSRLIYNDTLEPYADARITVAARLAYACERRT